MRTWLRWSLVGPGHLKTKATGRSETHASFRWAWNTLYVWLSGLLGVSFPIERGE